MRTREHGRVEPRDGTPRRRGRRAWGPTGALLAAVVLPAACTGTVPEPSTTSSPAATTTSPAPSPSPSPSPSPTVEDPFPPGPVLGPPGAVEDVLTGIVTPWDLAFLPSGAVLVTLRDTAEVLLITDEDSRPLTGPGAQDLAASTDVTGEGGLLGLELSPEVATDRLVYLYRSTSSANQVVRAVLDPDGTLGPLQLVLDGIPHASFHDGGRLAFGPDGFLYVTTGDAGVSTSSQDPSSLAGKILRLTPEGGPAPGNPVEGSPVWSLGHRNVQGIGWDEDGRMFASEFGQNTWDELNVIVPGGNYGWPVVEGPGGGAGFVDPVMTWRTADASPSGIAVTPAGVLLAALRGERIWQVPVAGDEIGEPRIALDGFGRLRDVTLGPDGALWVLTSNRDGRGDPRDGDDRVLRLAVPEGT